MAGLHLDVLRVGKRYRLTNFGEKHDFVVEATLPEGDFRVKDLDTLEPYNLKELIAYGHGKDYVIEELYAE